MLLPIGVQMPCVIVLTCQYRRSKTWTRHCSTHQ